MSILPTVVEKKFFISGCTDFALGASTTYLPPLGSCTATTATEAQRQMMIQEAGTLKKFRVKLTVAPGAGNSKTLTVRKNEADTLLVVTISEAATEGEDLTNIVSVVRGDRISIYHSYVGTPASGQEVYGMVFEFA